MKFSSTAKSSLVALGVGALQYLLLLCSFMLLLRYLNPFGFLVDLGLRGNALYLISGVLDLIWAVLFSFPAAITLLKLNRKKIWFYVLLAVIPTFLWVNLGLGTNPIFHENWGGFMRGWINQLLPLPIAVLLLQKIYPGKTHNDSFNTDASKTGAG